jgi:hypothetical protein
MATVRSLDSQYGELMPALPLQRWLAERLESVRRTQNPGDNTLALLASKLGTDERRLRFYFKEQSCRRFRVEDMLAIVGVRIEELYPHLADDTPLEDDAYCQHCRETVLPIHGECPWCDTQLTAVAA